MTKFYVDTNGVYLGGFDNATPPNGSIEIFNVPENGNDIWNGVNWIPLAQTAIENKTTASNLLSATDWTTISDVANPINSPYLANQTEFIAYRNEIRKIAVNPVEGNLIWATVPKAIWG